MYLDASEEKMLRAIVHSAVVSAAAGGSFVGEFRQYRVCATCIQVNESGLAKVALSVLDDVGNMAQICRGLVLVDRQDPT